MTVEAADPTLALRATPLLRAFNRAGVLASADVHVAQRLGRLLGEDDERVLLAVALAVRGVRGGSVCVDLQDLEALSVRESEDRGEEVDLPWPDPGSWQQIVTSSPLVAVGVSGAVDRPLRWVSGRLYLDRYWRHERTVRTEIDARLRLAVDGVDAGGLREVLHRLFPEERDARQRLGAAAAVLSRVSVLTGGPGTGKTTTVARVLAVLQAAVGPGARIALAAPTGKAAARLQEAVLAEVAGFSDPDRGRVGDVQASTVHRLLGWKPGTTTRFRHDRSHHLPHDVVIVDETSMVSLTLMARLLEALKPSARLLLVGDPDQLASVEAGAVLGDLVARPPVADRLPAALQAAVQEVLPEEPQARAALRNGVVRLEVVHRFGGAIQALAEAIRCGRAEESLTVLRGPDGSVEFVETREERATDDELDPVRSQATEAGAAVVAAARAGDVGEALRALESHRVLLAHRRGPAGVRHWAALVEAWVAEAAGVGEDEGLWYRGRPLLVTVNDRDSGLYNGDTGVVVDDGAGGVVAAFGTPSAPLLVRSHRLPPVETVHAMTVHRGQGSQFASVSVVLPPPTSPLLTRELLYTAVTRARARVRVVGTEAAVRAAVERPIRRASGLRHPLES